jgi:hypothetical protein
MALILSLIGWRERERRFFFVDLKSPEVQLSSKCPTVGGEPSVLPCQAVEVMAPVLFWQFDPHIDSLFYAFTWS